MVWTAFGWFGVFPRIQYERFCLILRLKCGSGYLDLYVLGDDALIS